MREALRLRLGLTEQQFAVFREAAAAHRQIERSIQGRIDSVVEADRAIQPGAMPVSAPAKAKVHGLFAQLVRQENELIGSLRQALDAANAQKMDDALASYYAESRATYLQTRARLTGLGTDAADLPLGSITANGGRLGGVRPMVTQGGGGGGFVCQYYALDPPEAEQDAIDECDDEGGVYNLENCECGSNGGGGGGGGGGGSNSGVPAVSGFTPTPMELGTNGLITVYGSNFKLSSGASIQISDPNVTVTNVKILNSNTISANFNVPPNDTLGNYTLTVNFTGVAIAEGGNYPQGPFPLQIGATTLSISSLQYTNSQAIWLDSPSNPTPTAAPDTVWTPTSTQPSVFVAGNTISATAKFNVSPAPPSTISGVRIEGAISGLGLLVGTVSIPAWATSVPVNLTGNTAFPANTTFHNAALPVTWSESYTGQPCASSTCFSAGNTSSEVYATLAAPSGLSESVMPLTAVKLAIGSGGATTPAAALQNTWNQFAGPANVTGWDGRLLYYYETGVPFGSCATDSVGLLTSTNGINGSGQCGAWAFLLMDAFAVNGITSSFVQIQPTDKSSMLIKNWAFNATSSLYPAPYYWNLTLPVETVGPGMVPFTSVSGGVASESGVSGQNSPTPSEKFFGLHFIVQAPSNLGGGYYDPSYGVTYGGQCGFESSAVVGYALPSSTNSPSASTWNFGVRQPAGGCNITFTTRFSN